MIEYQMINRLVIQPKQMLWVLKRTVGMRRFFQASNYNLNLMSLKTQIQCCALNCVYLDSDVYSMYV